jgi:DNA-binding GntR family transcriptional regulator
LSAPDVLFCTGLGRTGDQEKSTVTTTDFAASDFYEQFGGTGARELPKYARFREMLFEAIKAGYWKPGAKLPTELEFAKITPFSLGTVQRALNGLAEEGIVVRRHGLGSFVAETHKPLEDPWHCKFLDDTGEGSLPVYSKVLARRLVKGRGPWSEHLGQPSGGILRIDRTIGISDEFNVYSRFFTDPALLKPLAERPLRQLDGKNFMALIASECNLPITQLTNDVRVTSFDREVAENVEVAAGTMGLLVQAVARSGRETCIYYQELFVPPTKRLLRFAEAPAAGKTGQQQ